jgi:hypothetical protein
MPRRPSRRDTKLQDRIAERRSRQQTRYLLIAGLSVGGLVLLVCGGIGVYVVGNIIRVETAARQSGGTPAGSSSDSDTKMAHVLADPDSFPDVQAVNRHLGPGRPVSRDALAAIAVTGTDDYGWTGRRTLDHYFSRVPKDAVIYHWSRPNQDLYLAFGTNPHFMVYGLLKAVLSDRQGATPRIKTRG